MPRRRTRPSRLPVGTALAGTALALSVLTGTVLAAAAPAHATASAPLHAVRGASLYRYWTYWKSAGGRWRYATVGPASVPPDGGVEGWRFEVSAEGAARPPRRRPDFAAICRGVRPRAGHKRVAVVVDFGTAAAAPSGETRPANVRSSCADLPEDATGYQALSSQFPLRTAASGLVCALDGYPRHGCATAAGSSAAQPRRSPERVHRAAQADAPGGSPSSGGPVPYATIAGVVAAGALAAAAFRRARGRT